MSEKNWLIRTKSNHILGPVSLDKIRELLTSESIKGDDEICSGNGFWFYVRESDLVNEFIHDRKKQCFNPVQEAEKSKNRILDQVDDEFKIETEKEVSDDITQVLKLETIDERENQDFKIEQESKKKSANYISTDGLEIEAKSEEEDTLESSDIDQTTDEVKPSEKLESSAVTKKKIFENNQVKAGRVRVLANNETPQQKPDVKSIKRGVSMVFLYIVGFIFLALAILAFYYKDSLLDEINSQASLSLFPSAIAQDLDTSKKKNGII